MLVGFNQKKSPVFFLMVALLIFFAGCDFFEVDQEPYNVTGRIVDKNGEGVEGVTIAFNRGFGAVTTDEQGAWTITGLTGTVLATPLKTGWNFSPFNKRLSEESDGVQFIGIEGAGIGDQKDFRTGSGLHFNMRLAPGAKFPRGGTSLEVNGDELFGVVEQDYYIAELPVTYQLWHEVKEWAEEHGYRFMNPGREGNQGHQGADPTPGNEQPVTAVSWYDVLVWCNALSEHLEYQPVYYEQGEVIKDASAIDYQQVKQTSQDGFRLPTVEEWELAARFIGPQQPSDSPRREQAVFVEGLYWTPGNYASGARDSIENSQATREAAWHQVNSAGQTQQVGQKPQNGNDLGLFDMSGNVWEWCFSPRSKNLEWRIIRGGSVESEPVWVQVSRNWDSKADWTGKEGDCRILGFRLVKNK